MLALILARLLALVLSQAQAVEVLSQAAQRQVLAQAWRQVLAQARRQVLAQARVLASQASVLAQTAHHHSRRRKEVRRPRPALPTPCRWLRRPRHQAQARRQV